MNNKPDDSMPLCLPPHRAAAVVLADLAPLLAGRVPVDRALRIVASQQRGGRAAKAARSLGAAVTAGRLLSDAMREEESFYGTAAVAAARAGESSGALPEALGRYVEHLHAQRGMRRKMFAAMAYPIVVCVVALVAVILLLGLVVPRLGALLEALGGVDLAPWPTRALLSLSVWVGNENFWMAAGFILLILAWFFRPRRNGGLAGRLIRGLPLLGSVLQNGALARSTATLSTLLNAGVPLPEALHLCGPAGGDAHLASIFSDVAAQVSHGVPMSAALRSKKWLGLPMVTEVTALGEETGALAEQLDWVSRELESRASAGGATLLALVEPVLIVVMALVVGLVASALFLPVISLADRVGP